MSVYSRTKEMFYDMQNFKQDNRAAWLIVDLLRIVSFLVLCLIFMVQYWKVPLVVNTEVLPVFPATLREFLDKYTFKIFIGLLIYKAIGKGILRNFVASMENKFDIRLFPVSNTVEDIFEIGTMFLLLLKLSGNLILCFHGEDRVVDSDINIYIVYLICGVILFVDWLYKNNVERWYFARIRYTPYFDCVGNRIAQEDNVIYYGRIYKVRMLYEDDSIIFREERDIFSKKDWYLTKYNSGLIRKEILLEEAVRDEKGKIKVYEYGMGEKKR